MNVVVLVGRLTQDPVLRTTNTGRNVCSFSIAVDRRYKQEGQPTADFINCVAWNRTAEVITQYLSKGRQIAVSGHLQTRSYQAQDGSNRYVTEVVVENFDFIGSRNDNAGAGYQNQNYNSGYSQQSNYSNQAPPQQGYNSAPNQAGYNQQNQAPIEQKPLEIDDDFSLLAEDDEVPF